MDHERGYRRLARVQHGAVTVLWEDAVAYPVGEPTTLVIDAVGDRLRGRLGDEELFDVIDAAHPRGRVGLYCWANTGARFEHLTVERPPLDAYAWFRDHFAAGDLAPWVFADEGDQAAPSAWAADSGALLQTSNLHSLPLDAAAVAKRGTLALTGDPAWDDVVFMATLSSADDDAIGLVFRYQGPDDFYRLSFDSQRSYRRLVRCAGGVFTVLWEDDVSYELDREYELIVAAIGRRITAWLDGVPLLELDDAAGPRAGRVGLYCWANTGARFSRVRVLGPERLTTDVLAADEFEWEVPGLWRFLTAGDRDGPATWDLVDGELRQTSNVAGGRPGQIVRPGTTAIAGDPAWTDYRTVVRLRSDDDDGIGVVVRHLDPQHWYRFSMDHQRGYRRLVKCVGGAVTELWADAVAYDVGREYLVTIDAIGDVIAGYIDGVPLFAVRDGDINVGAAGLYCRATTGASFHSFRVIPVGWRTHYRFGSEEPALAAGTRVIIHSGNNHDPVPAAGAGATHRFIAPDEGPGRSHLATTLPATLRLRDPRGGRSHRRTFLPDADYVAIPGARVLRRADGLDFALVVPSADAPGSRLRPGDYRLRFTYRRDNSTAELVAPILSQAGDISDEVVTLRVAVR
jgi:hypothetical protein